MKTFISNSGYEKYLKNLFEVDSCKLVQVKHQEIGTIYDDGFASKGIFVDTQPTFELRTKDDTFYVTLSSTPPKL